MNQGPICVAFLLYSLAAGLLVLSLGACSTTVELPPTELVVDPATAGLPDDRVATVYWDCCVFGIDDLHEPPNTRESMFFRRFVRLLPGEHHFFMDIYHNKSNYEFNWVFGELAAGHEYRLERAETSGFLWGTTLWVIRDVETNNAIAESVDCHEYCSILDALRTMHVQDGSVRTLALPGNLACQPPTGFDQVVLVPVEQQSASLDAISGKIRDVLEVSGLPIASSAQASDDLVLAIESLELYCPGNLSASFDAYGLDGHFQVFLALDVVLRAGDGTELDRWLVADIGESRHTGGFFTYLVPTYQAALDNAANRIGNRLVYDLRRRFLSARRQNVLKTWSIDPAGM